MSHATSRPECEAPGFWGSRYALGLLAAGVVYPFTLSPNLAALSMSGSTALVAINALLLKHIRLTGIKLARIEVAPAAAAPVASRVSA